MTTKPKTVLGDLADWELPSLEARMGKLITFLQRRQLSIALDRDSLGEQVYSQLWEHVRELGATAANEAVAGWMQGAADGRPDLCVSFAYLEGDSEAEPLTILYSVGALDGSRMELRRIDLEETLLEEVMVDNDEEAELNRRRRRSRLMAAHLRKLADKIDNVLGPSPSDGNLGSLTLLK
jgi:hypothetical protein